MKIIDNRYKIEKNIYNDFFVETYKVEDLWKNNNVKFMKMYHYNLQKDLMDYFMMNQIKISNIKHKNILHSEEFNIVKTIDTKITNMTMYYSISEYIDYTTLREKNSLLTFKEKLRILLDIILAIDFLHFRGFIYKFANPDQIAVLDNNTVKLQNIGTIVEKVFNNDYSEFERRFLSPDFISDNRSEEKAVDYYSLGQLIEYMFLDQANNLEALEVGPNKSEAKAFLKNIIIELEKHGFKTGKKDLIGFADKIIEYFDLDYEYDLVKERDFLFLDNKIVGRDRDIEKILHLDNEVYKKLNQSNIVMVNGEDGIGKTSFLKEVKHRLKLKSRNIYSIEIKKRSQDDMLDIGDLLRQTMNDTPNNLKEKYRKEFSSILPELRLSSDKEDALDVNNESKKYRIYNRIANYLKDLSTNKITYIFLDDIQNCSDNFLNLLDYLINNLIDDNIIFVFSYDEDEINKKNSSKAIIDTWKKDLNVLDIKLHKLDLEEIGEIIQNVVGIAYVPLELSSTLFKESQGSPKKIEELMTYLYNIGQLYMNTNGRWMLNIEDYADIYIPPNLDDNMLQQLSIVQENYYEIIKSMSVFEDLLHKNILIKMLDLEAKSLELLIDELIRIKLIEEKLVDWGYSYSINNPELKRLIYFEIPENEKTELHAKAANVIEKLDGELYDFLFEELIYQLIKSMQNNKALEIILHKIELLENKNSSQAKYLLEKAYSIVTSDTKEIVKLEILEKLIDIALLKGELSEDNSHLREYQYLAEKTYSKYHILNYKKMKAELYYQRGNADQFREKLEEINEINENISIFKLYYLTSKSKLAIQEDKLEKAKENLEESVTLAIELGLEDQLGDIYNKLGIVENLSGNPKLSIDHYEKSYDYFIKSKDIIGSIKPINNLGIICADYLNDEKKAMEYYQRGIEVSAKYGIKRNHLIFLINISELNMSAHNYDKALEEVLEANKMAMELQDINTIIVCQSLLGIIYLEIEEYEKACECYQYIRPLFEGGKITDLETSLSYYEFLAIFDFYMGRHESALENINSGQELASRINIRQYYKMKFKVILVNYFTNNGFDKAVVDDFIEEYKSTRYVEDLREAILIITLLSISKGDRIYASKFLEYDSKIKAKSEFAILNKLRSLAIAMLIPNNDNTNKIIQLEKDIRNEAFIFKTIIMTTIASVFSEKGRYKEAIKYNIEALDNIYKNAVKISEWDYKLSFIRVRDTDQIKEDIAKILKNYYGKDITRLKLDDIDQEEDFAALNNYFDLTDVIEAIGKEEYSQITKIHSYGEALTIEGIHSLLSMLKDDYKYNLDLILNYISKEAFATNAYILEHNKESDDYEVISSLNANADQNINEGILKIANRTEKGLLINTNLDNSLKKTYRSFLSEDVSALICVPIYVNTASAIDIKERRKNKNGGDEILGYIYLETERVFNNFGEDMLDIIESIIYLVYINLENNKLKLIATTDKLTGTFTRKYYDKIFKELIESKKNINGKFSVLMLDLDKFKIINDTYGHRKGDEVLRQVGKTIKTSIRNSDVVGRYGGEEFVVLLRDSGEKESLLVGEKIRRNIENLNIEGIKNPITISIGISLYPYHSKFKEDLIEKADQALYYAKQTGRNRVCMWNTKMDNAFERVDKLAGILTGTSEIDNKNILGLVQIIQLIEERNTLKEKAYKFLGELLNVVDAEVASLIILDKNAKKHYTRRKSIEGFIDTPNFNEKIIDRIIESKKGEFLIDWDNLEDVDSISGIPNWQSVIVIPMIKNGKIKGVIYVSAPLKKQEFDFNLFNLTKNYSNIFTSLL